jgi:ABC-2 type transport system ATP-binding protein
MACGVLTPTRGEVEICGVSLARDPFRAKALLGVVPQQLAIYEELTATQNLRYFGALYGLSGALLAERIAWALDVVGLRDRSDELVRNYSGGMQRRLNLAAGLLHRPELLILDEPTVGVDPQSRNHIFATVRALRDEGMAIVYTSHYMEEVEALCDRIAVIDRGAIIATGTIAELVAQHAGRGLELELAGTPDAVEEAIARASEHAEVHRDGVRLHVIPRAELAPMIAALEQAGVTIARIASREATLETAFLSLTGRALRDDS